MQDQPGAPEGGSLWRVTHVDDSTMIGDRGGFQRSKKVYYQTSDGSQSYVELPLTSFNRANVERLINDHLNDLLDVLTLTGPPLQPPPY